LRQRLTPINAGLMARSTFSNRLPQVRFHDLRRWFATVTLTATHGNVHAAGTSMGHSRKSNHALDVYGALTPEIAKMVGNGIEGPSSRQLSTRRVILRTRG
jgi:hypothetical protein